MRTLAFDGRMGASGDMLLAALLAAGADRDALAPVGDALPLRYEIVETIENGIGATSVTVVLTDDDSAGDGSPSKVPSHGDDHDHSHSHGDNDHDHSHSHDGSDTHAEGHGPTRSYAAVREIVDGMDLPDDVRRDALAIFELLGEAEAAVHDTALEEMHFHEVGADDAIADVVGFCLLVDDLGVERVATTPLSVGGGTAEMSHGTYPVPGPAVVEIAERADWSCSGGPVEAELLTPTGAAILAHVADGAEALPELRVDSSGYGAGGYSFEDRPNVLRAIVGEGRGGLRRDEITVLETNLDDAPPEVLGGLQERLHEAGARDVSILPATMKKSRPGHLVKVICKPEDSQQVARRLAEETGTLGVREHGAGHRWIANRRVVTTTLLEAGERYEVRVKVGMDADGSVFDVSAEYDDALAVAGETGLAVRNVSRRAETAAREGGATDDVLVHIVEAERWAEFEDTDAYTHPSLDEQGFVHCSTTESVLPVARYNYADATDPRLLVVERAAVEDDLRFEEMPGGTAYPHIYAELPTDVVTGVFPLERDEADRFVLPEELR